MKEFKIGWSGWQKATDEFTKGIITIKADTSYQALEKAKNVIREGNINNLCFTDQTHWSTCKSCNELAPSLLAGSCSSCWGY